MARPPGQPKATCSKSDGGRLLPFVPPTLSRIGRRAVTDRAPRPGLPTDRLAWPCVHRSSDGGEFFVGTSAEIRTFRAKSTQQTVPVLVRASLPETLRITHVDANPAIDFQLGIPSHFGSLIPRGRVTGGARSMLMDWTMAVRTARHLADEWPAVLDALFARIPLPTGRG